MQFGPPRISCRKDCYIVFRTRDSSRRRAKFPATLPGNDLPQFQNFPASQLFTATHFRSGLYCALQPLQHHTPFSPILSNLSRVSSLGTLLPHFDEVAGLLVLQAVLFQSEAGLQATIGSLAIVAEIIKMSEPGTALVASKTSKPRQKSTKGGNLVGSKWVDLNWVAKHAAAEANGMKPVILAPRS